MLNKIQEDDKKKKKPVDDEPDDMEEYMEFQVQEPINKSSSVFDKNAFNKTGGINTEPSVFDKKALFNTNTSK
ncbi:MAG: hypothetical protein FWD34_01075 [Oscillospiraceae bacterium]|nr:hypothetical protein [Oscillospiraceae bacterium]